MMPQLQWLQIQFGIHQQLLHLKVVPPDPTCIALILEIPAIVAPPPTTSPLVTNPTFNVVRVDIPTTCIVLREELHHQHLSFC